MKFLPVVLALLGSAAQAQITKVVNAASFVKDASLTPGSIMSVFGRNLANTEDFARDPNNVQRSLGGVTVAVGGIAGRLFYVSPTQVNAQIDPAVPLGPQTLQIASPAGTHTFSVTIERAGAPGLFSMSGTGTRDGAILNAVTFARGPFSVTTGGAPTWLAIYATGLDLSAPPRVTLDGVAAPVQYYGPAPGWVGLQQINVQLLPSLAGAGRVEVAITAGGKTSNIVELVILPNKGQWPFAPEEEHRQRNREIASMAWVPGTSLVLLADENDDVVRVIDVKKREVIATITLPEGAEPVALAVNAAGTRAVVAERERGKAAILDVAARRVLAEVTVGGGPSSVAIVGDRALVVNQDTDNVSLINLAAAPGSAAQAAGTIAVGRAPRAVAAAGSLAFVTNQGDGTVSIINLGPATPVIASTVNLGANSRPQAIGLIPSLGLGVVTEPSSDEEGKAVVFNLATGAIVATIRVNPDKSGGSSDIAVYETTVYFANQSGGSVTIARAPAFTPTILKVDIGARALAIDALDKVLLVSSQGSGNIVLVDLNTNQIIGRINAVRGENEREDEKNDNREDREKAANLPAITALNPKSARAGASFALIVAGTNLAGATELIFIDPDSLPGRGKGKGREEHGNHGHGPFGKRDPGFTVTNITVNPAGTQLTATVAIAASVARGDRLVRVGTPNGESTFKESGNNTFKVE